MSSTDKKPPNTPEKFSWGMTLPLAIFLALAGLLFFGLSSGDPSRLPSALIG